MCAIEEVIWLQKPNALHIELCIVPFEAATESGNRGLNWIFGTTASVLATGSFVPSSRPCCALPVQLRNITQGFWAVDSIYLHTFR